MRNVKLTIAYDGTNYHGFQEQKGSGLITVQEVLERCLAKLAGKKIKVTGAARTDAGVHARGQVVNFDISGWNIPVHRIPLALNGILPDDIVAIEAESVHPGFHARYNALAKIYCYVLYNNCIPSPFWRLYSYFVPRALNIGAMTQAAKFLEGEHDFASFQASGSSAKTTIRRLYKVEVKKRGELVILNFQGNGFLYNMVRIMVGTVLEVGFGKLRADDVKKILESRNRTLAGPTVPARGLCLEKVEYLT